MDAAALVAGFALLVATALLVTASLRLRSPVAFVFGVYNYTTDRPAKELFLGEGG